MTSEQVEQISKRYNSFSRTESNDYIFGVIDGVDLAMRILGYRYDPINKQFYKYMNATAE